MNSRSKRRLLRSLALSAAHEASLIDSSRAAYPREACGVLIGREANGDVVLQEITVAANLSEQANEFTLDPVSLVNAEARALELQAHVVGVWHSHPDQPAVPSARDRSGVWASWKQLIVSLNTREVSEIRAWRIVGEPEGEAAIEELQVLRASDATD